MIGEFGSNAPIGSKAKIGASAWGAKEEQGGTVLFDGTVTLAKMDGGGLYTENIALNENPVIGYEYSMTINGHEFTGTAEERDGSVFIMAVSGESGCTLNVNGEYINFACSEDVGQVGENTLKIVQYEGSDDGGDFK